MDSKVGNTPSQSVDPDDYPTEPLEKDFKEVTYTGSGWLFAPKSDSAHTCRPPADGLFRRHYQNGWRWRCDCGETFEYDSGRMHSGKDINVPGDDWYPWWPVGKQVISDDPNDPGLIATIPLIKEGMGCLLPVIMVLFTLVWVVG